MKRNRIITTYKNLYSLLTQINLYVRASLKWSIKVRNVQKKLNGQCNGSFHYSCAYLCNVGTYRKLSRNAICVMGRNPRQYTKTSHGKSHPNHDSNPNNKSRKLMRSLLWASNLNHLDLSSTPATMHHAHHDKFGNEWCVYSPPSWNSQGWKKKVGQMFSSSRIQYAIHQ